MNELVLIADIVIKENNLDQYAIDIKKQLNEVSTELNTDDDFAEAETLVKSFKKSEDALMAAKEKIFDTGDLRKINDTIIELHELCRDKRLTLDKAVKSRKEQIKNEMLDKAVAAVTNAKTDAVYSNHINIPQRDEFKNQIKGKRTTETMQEALDRFVGIQIQDIASQTNAINKKVKAINTLIEGSESLFDMNHLISFAGDYKDFIIKKIENHKAEVQAQVDARVKQQAMAEARQSAQQQQPAQQQNIQQPAQNQQPDPVIPEMQQQNTQANEPTSHYILRVDYVATNTQAVQMARRLAGTFGRENVNLSIKQEK